MTKIERQQVFDKYEGHCAYCGEKLQKGWHVDHIEPIRRNTDYYTGAVVSVRHPQNEHHGNYNPACASCNINKHSMSLEEFRSLIQGFMKHLNEINTQYKISKRYGLVIEDIKPVVFYFERYKKPENIVSVEFKIHVPISELKDESRTPSLVGLHTTSESPPPAQEL